MTDKYPASELACKEKAEQARLYFEAVEKLKREKKHNNRFLRRIGMNHTMESVCHEVFSVKMSGLYSEDHFYSRRRCVVCGHIEESTGKVPTVGY
jgi:hypothetical protein